MTSCIVIDDSQDVIDVFCELLKIVKIDVLSTGNDGKDAVKLYEQYHPDVVFTDLQMPNYDGFYVIENIKDVNSNAKIIVVTGDPGANNSHFFHSLNIPVIHKPFDIYTIKQAITDVLLNVDNVSTPFEIQYTFKDDINVYSCTVTYKQYRNFKKLPIIQECEIVNKDQKKTEQNQTEIQKALDLAVKNDTRYILKLSEIVK